MEELKKFNNQTLAVIYRPKTFDDLVEQEYIKAILLNQLKTNTTKQAYLFCGPAGDGKTTSARIFANEINSGKGKPIEIDAASNNGVDDVRQIIEDSKRKPLDTDYKVFIIDEVHMLSTGAWNAMLKLLEEPPKTSIFIMCTTDPQKIPATILSRVQRYNFSKISTEGIFNRLKYICDKENEKRGRKDQIKYDDNALYYIANYAEGGMRNAITMLDKCISLNTIVNNENVVKAIGSVDFSMCKDLLNAFIYSDTHTCIELIDIVHSSGKDLKYFIKQFQYFLLDILKAKMFDTLLGTKLPNTAVFERYIKSVDYNKCADILDFFVKLNADVKWESNIREFVECAILINNKGVN